MHGNIEFDPRVCFILELSNTIVVIAITGHVSVESPESYKSVSTGIVFFIRNSREGLSLRKRTY